jgi:hypothetical protein
MKVLFKETNPALAILKLQEIILKLTMSLKPLKKKKSFKDMVTSWTANSESAKKKSKL